MKNAVVLSLVLLALPLFSSVSFRSTRHGMLLNNGNSASEKMEKTPVIVELFTSEGCSSCPPADQLLARLEAKQPVSGALIIPLSEHVDYWNRLGWTDPYSSRLFSERQGEYARAFSIDGPYTPQMVVDGRSEFVGSNGDQASRAIAEAAALPKTAIHIAPAEAESRGQISLTVSIEALNSKPREAADVLLAMTESGLSSSVSRGENAGRRLTHTAVVRKLINVGVLETGKTLTRTISIETDSAWKSENLRAVVFVQERDSRRVLGAASTQVRQPVTK